MDHQDSTVLNPLKLRSGLFIYPAQSQAIETLLAELLEKLPARLILLVESSGQVISFLGSQVRNGENSLDPVGLGALVAGDLAASQEIARLTGEYQAFQLVLRQGQSSHIFISEAGHTLALLVQVSSEVPLGWARMLIVQVAHRLADVLAQPPSESAAYNLSQVLPPAQSAAAPEADAKPDPDLSELLNHALDSIWTDG